MHSSWNVILNGTLCDSNLRTESERKLEGELLDSVVNGAIKSVEILLGAVSAGGDEVDDAKGELVDDALEDAEHSGDGGGEGGAGDDAGTANDNVEKVLVNLDELVARGC